MTTTTPVAEDTVPVAARIRPLLVGLLGEVPAVRVEFWDGSAVGPPERAPGVIRVRTPDALRRILWAPDELGLGRAYVSGDLDVEGDLYGMLRALRPAGRAVRSTIKAVPGAVVTAHDLRLPTRPLPPPPEEARPAGRRHSKLRDAEVVRHHYDVGNEFYRLVLGPAMTYSCARFDRPGLSLEEAQASKHELICRKLGLHERPDARLLDVGCGWGSMAMHAAERHAARVVGVTISEQQVDLARTRVADAGLEGRVDIRLQDYRDLTVDGFDAISSIGMFEHVGRAHMQRYFTTLHRLLVPTGRLVNHAISRVGGSRLGRRTFAYRYVFPDAELVDVADVVRSMEAAGFEVRDVESLREHYAQTLRRWGANLDEHWDEAVALVGPSRARIWKLYMAASAVGFEDGGLAVHQVLGVRTDEDGGSGMPPTRDGWSTP